MRRIMAVAGVVLLVPGAVWPLPPYARFYKEKYGYLPNCAACHRMQDWRLNGYGEEFEDNGRTLAALSAAEKKDSDGDGVKNGDEARAQANPGDPNSRPDRLGEWLKEAKIRPPNKILRKFFPAYAEADVLFPVWSVEARATLDVFGDEALYPVVYRVKGADGATLGSAVHVSYEVPGLAHGTNMIVVAADAQGLVSGVEFVHHHGNAVVKDPAYLDKFKGWKRDDIESAPAAPEGAGNEAAALTEGVRMALSILKEAAAQ
jgi:hypothetical protein